MNLFNYTHPAGGGAVEKSALRRRLWSTVFALVPVTTVSVFFISFFSVFFYCAIGQYNDIYRQTENILVLIYNKYDVLIH